MNKEFADRIYKPLVGPLAYKKKETGESLVGLSRMKKKQHRQTVVNSDDETLIEKSDVDTIPRNSIE